MALRFDGQTVVITGVSRGLGPEYATYLANHGANVIVHDSANQRFADEVVVRITAAGGNAEAATSSAEDGSGIISAAIARFGRIDAVVHNDSYQVDAEWGDTGPTEWDGMLKPTFKGAYKCVQAAWTQFKKQKYGRIVCTSSIVVRKGEKCSPLQSIAIYGQLGFIQTISREGAKYNILASVLAPLTSAGLVQGIQESESELVSRTVAALIHPSNNTESGHLYQITNGRCSKLRWERASGALLNPDHSLTPGAIIEKWNEVNDFSMPDYPSQAADLLTFLAKAKKLPPNQPAYQVRLAGKVAIVTGAGAGLGRAYAICLASLGAHIVLNDIKEPIAVANEIRSAGGDAHMSICSVENGEKIVSDTIQKYGRLDIIVNNAGFVRDKSIGNMTDDIWDSIIAVHLKGMLSVTKAAWPYFVSQGYGRIVNVSSTSGIYGNFGQSNYSTAKCAIIGFSEALAREGARHNILVNTVAPVGSTSALAAATVGSSTEFAPEYCAPFVTLLCSDAAPYPSTSGLFEIAAGWHARTRLQCSYGARTLHSDIPPVEDMTRLWTAVADFNTSPPWYPEESEYGLMDLANKASLSTVLGRIQKAKTQRIEGTVYEYSDRDVILYNLTLGATWRELPLVYEHDKNFQPLPTFGVVPFFNSRLPFTHEEILPKWDPTKLLHGEHYLEIRKFPIPTSGKLVTYPRLLDVVDKRKAAVVSVSYTTRDVTTGEDIFYNEAFSYIRGAGGFSVQSDLIPKSTTVSPAPPSRQPDASRTDRTTNEQAALYRLNGDRNKMHIDPVTAHHGGFSRPILHGLCFFGIAGKHIYQEYGPFKNIRVRFAGTVDPGQTLRTEMWKTKDTVIFQMKVVETEKVCISGGRAELLNSAAGKPML